MNDLRCEDSQAPQLVLIGSKKHPHARELETWVADRGLDRAVRFVGYQDPDELLEWYNGAELLIHPSLHEGFSFTILEAMACGLPIVASRATSIPEAAGDAALYHDDALCDEELQARVRQALDDSQLRAKLSKQAESRASLFTWEKCVADSLAVYDRLN